MSLNANAKAFVPGGGGGGSVGVAAGGGIALGVTNGSAVPGGAPQEPQLYRYNIMLPTRRVVDVDRSPTAAAAMLSMLLSKRAIVGAGKAGMAAGALNTFVNESFTQVVSSNVPGAPPLPPPSTLPGMVGAVTNPSGFLLTREILSLSVPEPLHDLNDRDGFLLPLDVDAATSVDPTSIAALWQTFFAIVGRDFRITAMGYVVVQMPSWAEEALMEAPLRHYFFVACTAKQLVPITAQTLRSALPQAKRVIPVRRVVSYAVSGHFPIAAVVALSPLPSLPPPTSPSDENSSAKNGSDAVAPALTLKVLYNPHDSKATLASVCEMASALEKALSPSSGSQLVWSATNVVAVEVEVVAKTAASAAAAATMTNGTATEGVVAAENGTSKGDHGGGDAARVVPVPLSDVILLVRYTFSELLGTAALVVASEEQKQKNKASPPQHSQLSRIIASAVTVSTESSGALAQVLRSPPASDPAALTGTSNYLGCWPLGAFAALPSSDEYAAVRALLASIPRPPEVTLLTRGVFASAVEHLAKESYRARRSPVGPPVYVVIDASGKVFGVDSRSGATVSLPQTSWSNANLTQRDCVVEATLVPSYRGEKQFRIIVHDVLVWSGHSVAHQPFPQRWQNLEASGLEDEASWPHRSPFGVVVLRSAFVVFNQANQLITSPQMEHPTLGLVFVPATPPRTTPQQQQQQQENKGLYYRWKHPDSVTARFAVGAVTVVDPNRAIHRATLLTRAAASTNSEEEEHTCSRTGDDDDASATLEPYDDEYVDYFASCPATTLSSNDIVECMLRRTPDGAHWWEVLRHFPISSYKQQQQQPATTSSAVSHVVNSPPISLDEMRWLLTSASFICSQCSTVSDVGSQNAEAKAYMCRPCWEKNGYGDCASCGKAYVQGGHDSTSQRFHCEACWTVFTTPKAVTTGAPPPPADATFSRQASTRVIALLIDAVATKVPTSDILELCCGGAVVRKWLMGTAPIKYLGIDVKASVLDEIHAMITTNRLTTHNLTKFDIVCADAFSPEFWSNHLLRIHPSQFHVITCFSGLHRAFSSEKQARELVAAIANALVPNGAFVGSLLSTNALFRKGRRYRNSVFSVDLEDRAAPSIGTPYKFSVDGSVTKERYVVPLDFLVAVAQEYGLVLLQDQCQTFADVLAKDSKWTRALTPDEKEYLGCCMTFAFKKTAQRMSGAGAASGGGGAPNGSSASAAVA